MIIPCLLYAIVQILTLSFLLCILLSFDLYLNCALSFQGNNLLMLRVPSFMSLYSFLHKLPTQLGKNPAFASSQMKHLLNKQFHNKCSLLINTLGNKGSFSKYSYRWNCLVAKDIKSQQYIPFPYQIQFKALMMSSANFLPTIFLPFLVSCVPSHISLPGSSKVCPRLQKLMPWM